MHWSHTSIIGTIVAAAAKNAASKNHPKDIQYRGVLRDKNHFYGLVKCHQVEGSAMLKVIKYRVQLG